MAHSGIYGTDPNRKLIDSHNAYRSTQTDPQQHQANGPTLRDGGVRHVREPMILPVCLSSDASIHECIHTYIHAYLHTLQLSLVVCVCIAFHGFLSLADGFMAPDFVCVSCACCGIRFAIAETFQDRKGRGSGLRQVRLDGCAHMRSCVPV